MTCSELKIFDCIVKFSGIAEELTIFKSGVCICRIDSHSLLVTSEYACDILVLHRIIDFGEGDSLAYGRKKALYLCGNFLVSIFLGNFSSLYEFGLGIGEILVVIEFLADGKDN